MAPGISCFMVERAWLSRRTLRRFRSITTSWPCLASGLGCHDASAFLDEVEDHSEWEAADGPWPNDSDRWPVTCAHCDYVFKDEDARQLRYTHLYRRVNGPEGLFTLEEAAPGAMWYEDWRSHKGPDGHSLTVMTPDGPWCIDGPSSGGGPGWTRSGTPPLVSALPSILTPNYHGWLTAGVLIPC